MTCNVSFRDMFNWLQNLKEESEGTKMQVNCFDSESVPEISFKDIFGLVCGWLRMYIELEEDEEKTMLMCTILYIDRLVQRHGVDYFNKLTAHRIIIATFLLVLKFTVDIPPSNVDYAKFLELSPKEISRLERELIRLLDSRLHINNAAFVYMCSNVVTK